MNGIDSILAGKGESYTSFISKLEEILTPFAQIAVGQTPTYMGHIPNNVGAGTCEDGCHFVFQLDDTVVAVVARNEPKAAIYGCEPRKLEEEDHKSVLDLIARLIAMKEEDPLDKLINKTDLPPELCQVLKAAIKHMGMN